jgi:hypothetical protein
MVMKKPVFLYNYVKLICFYTRDTSWVTPAVLHEHIERWLQLFKDYMWSSPGRDTQISFRSLSIHIHPVLWPCTITSGGN